MALLKDHPVKLLVAGEFYEDEKPYLDNRDPEDDKFIRCAIAGRCRYLFSGDEDLLSPGKVGMIRIVPPEKFLAALGRLSGGR